MKWLSKRTLTAVALGILLSFTTASCSSPEETTISGEVDASDLPIVPIRASFVIDMEDEAQVTGWADYVVVATILSNDKTTYEDPAPIELSSGKTVDVGTPYTHYTIEVTENLKGNLQTNSPIKVVKDGGVTQDRTEVYVYENDELPKVGGTYILIAFAQDDGSILISGPNSNIPVEANNKQSIASTAKYKEYRKAVTQQVPAKRERFKSDYEK